MRLLEILRFHPGEEANDEGFARTLASYADVYVNDAFGTAHRAHASTVGMVSMVSERGAGFLMAKEVEFLSRLLGEVERPYLAVLGGAKVSDKIEVLESLLDRVDAFVIGGAMANTFLKVQGIDVGKSKVEEDKLPLARNFLRKARERGVSVYLPTDVVVASDLGAAAGRPTAVDAIGAWDMALDIGPETARGFGDRIARARTDFWNGPMGVFEKPAFNAGTLAVARAVALHGDLPEPNAEDGWGLWAWPLSKEAGRRLHPEGRPGAVPCETRFRVLRRSGHYTLIECDLLTGRKHQIRRHARLAGPAVVGDARYGTSRSLKFLHEEMGFIRLALHSFSLQVQLPGAVGPQVFQSPAIPPEILRLLEEDQGSEER